ncbi:hypothetical protein IKZ77_01530, partial [Candidatus Saccharibacteria bacterium]|nr:hypothetical protein [Candidatus Saccharibacteria bacterium]
DYRKQKRTLERCRQNKASERLDILNASSVNEAFYGNVKIKFRVERGVPTYHIYYSTTKKPDGDYHGHSVIEEIDGKFRERYHRHPLSEHGRQNVVGPNED